MSHNISEQNRNKSLIKREVGAIIRVSKTLEITNKLLSTANKPALLTYKSVIIGTQEWMVENLNVDHFRNGDIIPEAKTAKEWKEAGENEQPAWCYYDNNPEKGAIYGKLYNDFVVSDPRNICPTGWHVASCAEWETLKIYLGGFSVAGGKLKETGFEHWNTPNEGANNSSGFSALPSGVRDKGGFGGIGNYGCWWSDESNWGMNYSSSSLYRVDYDEIYGFSIRCVRD